MKLSIVLVSYDSLADLRRLLPTIPAGGHEVIVVDNHGADGVAGWVAAEHPQVRVVPAGGNLGYAGGNNLGIREAQGEWLLVLNPDTELTPGALDALLEAGEAHSDALVTPKIVDAAGRVYACGLRMHYTGITSRFGEGDDPARYRGTFPVPLPSGTALLARRAVFESLGGFDEAFWMYLEDVDLAIRARAAGQPILCAATAVVVHHSDPSITPFKLRQLERNRPLLMRKAASPPIYRRLRPALALTALATWAFAVLKGPAHVKARWVAARSRPAAPRPADPGSDAAWLPDARSELPFAQLVGSRRLARVLGAITTPLYRALRPR